MHLWLGAFRVTPVGALAIAAVVYGDLSLTTTVELMIVFDEYI